MCCSILFLHILACSGPGAGKHIAESIRTGYYGAAYTALVGAVCYFLYRHKGGRGWPMIGSIVFLVLHPAWTVSAINGDCGQFKVVTTFVIGLLGTCFLGFQLYFSSNDHTA
jgi:hypothetical protein